MKPSKSQEILLFQKGRQGLMRVVFGRTGIIVLLLLVQMLVLFSIFQFLETLIPYVFSTLAVFTTLMVIHVINQEFNTTVKMTWIILIMLLPAFGSMLYIFIRGDFGHRLLKRRLHIVLAETKKEFREEKNLQERLARENKGLYNLASYTEKTGGFPAYEQTGVKYFSSGEDAFQEMLRQLEQAEKFIFLEYFIVEEGYMWGRILKILSDKAQAGVEVRVMYDGTCELRLLPRNYPDNLRNLGIACKVFAPIQPFLSTHYNYRDHRKIMVIDGRVAFTGGINLADEYINKKQVYGHWKDTAVMVNGMGVDSFTLMFLQMWNMSEERRSYMTDLYRAKPLKQAVEGYVLPFADCPLDSNRVGQMIYMDILNRAEAYVHIMTPYLILDGEMQTALQFAAHRGVEVKIILPHIPDKKLIFAQSRSHYASLLKAGVQIYEYTPGFMHAKVFLSDDTKSVVGTINLDYRSLYHHFECALYMEKVPALADIKKDFRKTLAQCRQITMADVPQGPILMRIIGRILKLIAPLM